MALPLLEACGHVAVKDHEFCGDMGSQGATCFWMLSAGKRHIPLSQWDDERFGQICTHDAPGDEGKTFADLKSTIEKLCSVSHACDYETRKLLLAFFARIESLRHE